MSAAIRTLMIERLQFPSIVMWFGAGVPTTRQLTCQGTAFLMTVAEPAHDPAKRLMKACSSPAEAFTVAKTAATKQNRARARIRVMTSRTARRTRRNDAAEI